MTKKRNKKSSRRNKFKESNRIIGTDNNKYKNRPTISLCMIVKDEEEFLDKCLKSVKAVADEIIIIDTGSQDNTVKIAEKYTDKIYFHPWQDSFSEARNHYLEYASCDWIFQIDADEELVSGDINNVLAAVKNPDIDAIRVQIISTYRQGEDESSHNVERIFRNNGIIHYEGRVHNRLVGFQKPRIYPIRLRHYGYDLADKSKLETKHQRRIDLLKKDIQENPENPLPYHYLSCCYLPNGLFHETLETGVKAIELAETTGNKNPLFLWTRYNVAMAYLKLKDYENAEAMALSAIDFENRHIDSHYLLTLIYHDQAKWDEVIKHGSEYLYLAEEIRKRPEEFGIMVANSLSESWNVLILMGIAHHEKNSLKESRELFETAISISTDPFPILKAIAIYYYTKGLLSYSRTYLRKALAINKKDPDIIEMLDKIDEKPQNRQTISCCMIVKNEEEFLEKCLLSIKDYMDEIIIVDTGSTDNTVEIAKKFTDKVYFHPWENSFSKARNQVLQYATGDWVFQIDGDEELMKGSGEKFKQAIDNAKDADIIYVKIYSTYSNGAKKALHNFERLFRNNGKIHYEGSVHNRIIGGTKPFYSDIELWHYGYDVDEKKAEEKFIRTTTLLKQEIENNPENPLPRHYLSASYLSKQMMEEAIDEAKKAIELADAQNNKHSIYSWSYFIISKAYHSLGQYDQAKEYSLEALGKYPGHLDSYYILAVCASENGDWDDTLKFGSLFLEKLERYTKDGSEAGLIINNTMNEGPAVNILMGHACYANKDISGMSDYYSKAYDMAEDKWQVLWNIGGYHLDNFGNLDYASEFLNRAVNEAPEEHDAWYMLAKLKNKQGNIIEEKACLEKVINLGTEDNFIFNRLLSLYIAEAAPDKAMDIINQYKVEISLAGAELCNLAVINIETGNMESAIKCYMMAAEREPNLFEAWASLGELMLRMNNLEDSKVFLNKALDIKRNDLGTILNLCDIASRENDILEIVHCCELLLQVFEIPYKITLNNIDDLKNIIHVIINALGDNTYFKDQLTTVYQRLSLDQNMETQTLST
jgi:glycosyltransferase involved in cell wall biosynthesis